MKKLFLLIGLLFVSCNAQEVSFNKYFEDHTMRIDYDHTGDNELEIISIDQIYKHGIWAGSRKHLLDKFNNGRYYVNVFDLESNTLIYSKGFDSYFGEYKLSGDAAKGIVKTFHEVAVIPYPKNKIKFVVQRRNDKKVMEDFFETEIDPADVKIIREKVLDNEVQVFKSLENGDPHKKVDVVILGDGYTLEQAEKFKSDLERFTKIFFEQEPYKSQKNNFNVYGVFKPSEESGVDEPRADIYRNTSLNSTFNSMGSERYLLTEDLKSIHDIASHVPYDAIYIMCNSHRYGGGGIYNFYCTFTPDNQWHEYLFLHEFGHSFTGLADEYYTSSVAYNEFYPRGIEPVEPNITALLNKENVKWKDLLEKGIEVPTKWNKAEYDSTSLKWQKLRTELNNKTSELKRERASKEKIKEAEDYYAKMDLENSEKTDKYLTKSKYFGKVGVFEGAGYSSEGLYRSMLDCIMFSKGKKPFCKVCEKAIVDVINHYTE
ncbi:MAG: peptidase M64 [Melioribacteraceae bacterium]|nr:peptidase M64 [Melioribacteraceae bacterium]